MVSEELQKKIDQAIRLLQSIGKAYDGEIEVAYSGGKDSDVILQLAKESGIRYRAIYRNTTIDPPGTIAHVKEMGCEILQPVKYTFAKLIQKKGLPSRHRRFCCSELKEYKVLDKCIMGVRKSESRARNERYKESTECRFYGSKKNHVEAIYPILDWTDEDVFSFIVDRKIKLCKIYYNENGEIDIKKRLGCMCCPLASRKKRIEEFKKYPRMVKFCLRNMKIYFDQNKQTASYIQHNGNIYECFVHAVFFPGSREWEFHKNGIFSEPIDYKDFLEKYFKIDL